MVSENVRTFNDLMVNLEETKDPKKLVQILLNKTPILGYFHRSVIVEPKKRNELLKQMTGVAVWNSSKDEDNPNVHVLVDLVPGISLLHFFSAEVSDTPILNQYKKEELTLYDIWHTDPMYGETKDFGWIGAREHDVPDKEVTEGILTETMLKDALVGSPGILAASIHLDTYTSSSGGYRCFVSYKNEIFLIKLHYTNLNKLIQEGLGIRIVCYIIGSTKSDLDNEETKYIISFAEELYKRVTIKYPIIQEVETPKKKSIFQQFINLFK